MNSCNFTGSTATLGAVYSMALKPMTLKTCVFGQVSMSAGLQADRNLAGAPRSHQACASSHASFLTISTNRESTAENTHECDACMVRVLKVLAGAGYLNSGTILGRRIFGQADASKIRGHKFSQHAISQLMRRPTRVAYSRHFSACTLKWRHRASSRLCC